MRSIAFDQAAEYYDRTRQLAPGTQAAVIELLARELRGRGRCLEIGVGTGRIALDLHRAGIPMAGIDLARPMLDQLVQKTGGSPLFPLAVADATALPHPAAAFGAALACHVLHLVSPWQVAVEELLRTIAPGGVILVEASRDSPGVGHEVIRHFFAQTRMGRRPRPGLTDMDELDALMRSRAIGARRLPPVAHHRTPTIEDIVGGLEAGTLSGCWDLAEEERQAAATATREWARERFGPLDRPHPVDAEITWRAYDLPASDHAT